MSTPSALPSVQLSNPGHETSSSMATSAPIFSDVKKITTSNYSVAFSIPHQLYALGIERSKELEDKARCHFNIHTNWLYAKARREALERALVDMRRELEHLEVDLSAATKDLDDAIRAGYVKLKERSRPITIELEVRE